MPRTTSPNLASLLYEVEQRECRDHQFFLAIHSLVSNESRISKQKLVQYIDRMCKLMPTEEWLQSHAAELIHFAARDCTRLYIPAVQCIDWINQLSSCGHHHDRVQRCLSALITNGHIVPPRIVFKWINASLWDRWDKPAALMLLSHPIYQHWKELKTRTLCEWLDNASYEYNGNHGVFRFFGVLILRLRYVNEAADVLPTATESLARALYIVSKHDDFYFESLLEWVNRLRPSLRTKVRECYLTLLNKEILSLKEKERFILLAPATS